MVNDGHAESRRGRERRTSLRRVEQKVALRAFQQHAARAKIAYGAGELAGGGVAGDCIDTGEPVDRGARLALADGV